MKNKKIVNYVARIFRKNTKRSLGECKKLAKRFLQEREWQSSIENSNLGFRYEWELDRSTCIEEKVYTGEIYGKDWNKTYDIPYSLYEIRSLYKKQSRI